MEAAITAHCSPHSPACLARRPGALKDDHGPIAATPEVPAVPHDVMYGTSRMDESGRVADRAMTSALGWQPGTG